MILRVAIGATLGWFMGPIGLHAWQSGDHMAAGAVWGSAAVLAFLVGAL